MRIKEILKEKGMTQADLAEKLNITPETVSRQINGNPTLNSLRDIAAALEVEISDLFNSENSESIYVQRHGNYVRVGTIQKNSG